MSGPDKDRSSCQDIGSGGSPRLIIYHYCIAKRLYRSKTSIQPIFAHFVIHHTSFRHCHLYVVFCCCLLLSFWLSWLLTCVACYPCLSFFAVVGVISFYSFALRVAWRCLRFVRIIIQLVLAAGWPRSLSILMPNISQYWSCCFVTLAINHNFCIFVANIFVP